jgi:hypothetical protein
MAPPPSYMLTSLTVRLRVSVTQKRLTARLYSRWRKSQVTRRKRICVTRIKASPHSKVCTPNPKPDAPPTLQPQNPKPDPMVLHTHKCSAMVASEPMPIVVTASTRADD